MAVGRIDVCVRCGQVRQMWGRGLCSADYDRARQRGTLDEYPRTNRRMEDFAQDFKILRERGMVNAEIARTLGYRVSSISKTITRARAAGLLT